MFICWRGVPGRGNTYCKGLHLPWHMQGTARRSVARREVMKDRLCGTPQAMEGHSSFYSKREALREF